MKSAEEVIDTTWLSLTKREHDELLARITAFAESFARERVKAYHHESDRSLCLQCKDTRNETLEEAAKVVQCHETLDPDPKRSEGYRRAVSEILTNIRALKGKL